jgi:hypothetical protein
VRRDRLSLVAEPDEADADRHGDSSEFPGRPRYHDYIASAM